MKKILLTTALVAFAASASASTEKMYIKGGLGYGIGDKLTKVSDDGAVAGTTKKITGKTLRGFAGNLAVGYQFNETLAMELFGDFSGTKQNKSQADKELAADATATTQPWVAPGATYPLVGGTLTSVLVLIRLLQLQIIKLNLKKPAWV